MASLSYDDVLAKKVAFGTPKRVIERLTQLREELSWRRGACAAPAEGQALVLQLHRDAGAGRGEPHALAAT
jgi:hypothetical protein